MTTEDLSAERDLVSVMLAGEGRAIAAGAGSVGESVAIG